MDPLSPLPSFLEMKMMEEATSAAERGMKLAIEHVIQRTFLIQSPSWRYRIARFVKNLLKRYESEIRLFITYAVNRRCLRSNACAPFAESVYGGRRAKLGPPGDNEQYSVLPLNETDKTRLALILTFGPYIHERLDQLYQRWKQQSSSSEANDTSVSARLKALFVSAYPFLHMTKMGTIVIYQWLFLLGKTLYFDPASHLLGQVVRRTTLADAPQQSNDSDTLTNDSASEPAALNPIRKAILISLSSTFVLGWLRQFRNLLSESKQQQQSSEIPPPAPLPVKLDAKIRMRPPLSNPKLCPLCRQPRINPAASTSGYVFCHRCIVMFVREHGKCPVTGTKCPESRIVRIYEPTTTVS